MRRDWQPDEIRNCVAALKVFEREFVELMGIIETSDSTRDRLERTGTLRPDKALDLGIVGVAGRASGVDRDVRRDHPYAAYASVPVKVPGRGYLRINASPWARVAIDGQNAGTTPLARVLGDHPAVSAFSGTGAREDEGQHLQDVYPKAKVYGGAGRFAFSGAAHLTEGSPLATEASRERLLEILTERAAGDRLVELAASLPEGQRYQSLRELARALDLEPEERGG